MKSFIIKKFGIVFALVYAFGSPVQATTLGDFVDLIFNVLFNLSIVLLPLTILAGGIIFLTGATPSKIALGKKIMLWGAVIFGMMLISKFIITFTKESITFLR